MPSARSVLGQPVDPVALGDAVQVERDGRALADTGAVDLQRRRARARASAAIAARMPSGSARLAGPKPQAVTASPMPMSKAPPEARPIGNPEAQDLSEPPVAPPPKGRPAPR